MIQQLRYEGSRLDDVLAQIHQHHGDDANIVSAELKRSGGVAGFFSKEQYEVTVELIDPLPEMARLGESPVAVAVPVPVPDEPLAVPESEPDEPVAVPESEPDEPVAVLESEPDETLAVPEPAPDVPLAASPDGQRFADMLAEMIEDRVELSTTDPAKLTPTERSEPIMQTLSISEPVDLTSTTTGGPRSIASIMGSVHSNFRSPPPTPTEGVIAIVGGRAESVRVAVALAMRLGQSASDVLVAESGECDISPEEMAELGAESAWQRRTRGIAAVSVVIVVVSPGLAGHRWATRVLEELKPSQVRLAVAGWRPLDRLDQTIAGLGCVSVIDLVDSDAIENPAQLLELAVPVATIDERPATAAAFGGLLAAAPAAQAAPTRSAQRGSTASSALFVRLR